MALPTNVSYGTVTGRFLLAYADSGDPGPEPDGAPAKGSVIFRASPVKLLDVSATPAPVTILPAPVVANLNTSGYIEGYDGDAGVRLVATDDPDINPVGWTWQVEFRLTDEANVAVAVPTFSFSLPAGTTVDLASVSPVPSANGTFYITGPSNNLTVSGTTTGAAGSSASVVISGTTPNQSLAFTIPRGDKGDTGDLANFSVDSPLTYVSNTLGVDYNELIIDGGTA